jgi:preprotein translocase subunit SecG
MMALVITIHVLACAILIFVVLVQRGRGGGFIENLSGLESMIGPKTSAFLTKTTTVCAVVFFFTCLILALMSVNRSKSLLQGYKSPAVSVTVQNTTSAAEPVQAAAPAAESVSGETAAPAAPSAVEVPQQSTPGTITFTNTTRNAPEPRKGEVK